MCIMWFVVSGFGGINSNFPTQLSAKQSVRMNLIRQQQQKAQKEFEKQERMQVGPMVILSLSYHTIVFSLVIHFMIQYT